VWKVGAVRGFARFVFVHRAVVQVETPIGHFLMCNRKLQCRYLYSASLRPDECRLRFRPGCTYSGMLRLRVGEDREMFKSYRTGRVLAATWKTFQLETPIGHFLIFSRNYSAGICTPPLCVRMSAVDLDAPILECYACE